MPKQRLAIVGASVRAAAQSAVLAGFDVVGADLFADADLDGVCPITKIENYPDGLADWLAEQDVDAWMYTGALENYPDLVDRMAQITPLWGVSGEALRRCRDPLVLQEVLNKANVPFPTTRRATGEEHREPGWLAKTYRHSNGVGFWPIRLTKDSRRAHEVGAYVQQAVAGREYGASYAIDNGTPTLLGVTETLARAAGKASQDRGFLGAVGPATPNSALRSLLARLGDTLANRLQLNGLVGVDLIGEGMDWSVIEINPRYTASVEVLTKSRAVPCDRLFTGLGAPGEDSPGKAPRSDTKPVAKQIAYSLREVTVSKAFEQWGREECDRGRLADVPRGGVALASGDPVCTCFANAANALDASQEASRRVTNALSCLYETAPVID